MRSLFKYCQELVWWWQFLVGWDTFSLGLCLIAWKVHSLLWNDDCWVPSCDLRMSVRPHHVQASFSAAISCQAHQTSQNFYDPTSPDYHSGML